MNDIDRLLVALGETPAGLARRLGVSEATISRWRGGKHAPSGLYAERVAQLAAAVELRGATRDSGPQALVDALVDAAMPPPLAGDDDYRRGYRQGYRDAVAAMLQGLATGVPAAHHRTKELPLEHQHHDRPGLAR